MIGGFSILERNWFTVIVDMINIYICIIILIVIFHALIFYINNDFIKINIKQL